MANLYIPIVKTMKMRHVVALALTGWYLMTPPLASDGSLDSRAPLSRWNIDSSYDTADDCQGIVSAFARMYPNLKEDGAPITKAKVWPAVNGKCISTDDPRLAK
jgi:hypothetical protein